MPTNMNENDRSHVLTLGLALEGRQHQVHLPVEDTGCRLEQMPPRGYEDGQSQDPDTALLFLPVDILFAFGFGFGGVSASLVVLRQGLTTEPRLALSPLQCPGFPKTHHPLFHNFWTSGAVSPRSLFEVLYQKLTEQGHCYRHAY